MGKYTAEQMLDAARHLYGESRSMLNEYAALLREREAAKGGVTDEMLDIACKSAAELTVEGFDPCVWPDGHDDDELHAARAFMRAALEVATPMLVSARVPKGWQLVPIDATTTMQDAGGHANSEWLNDNAPIGESRYGGPVMRSVWEAMLAAAPKPETEE